MPDKRIAVYLETSDKKVFACAQDWPGWCRAGRDEDLALQALADAAPRYARVPKQAKVDFPVYTGDRIAVWVPSVPERTDDPRYNSRLVFTLGRLKPEVSRTTALAEVRAAIFPLARARPAAFADGWQPEVERWRDTLATNVRGWMLQSTRGIR